MKCRHFSVKCVHFTGKCSSRLPPTPLEGVSFCRAISHASPTLLCKIVGHSLASLAHDPLSCAIMCVRRAHSGILLVQITVLRSICRHITVQSHHLCTFCGTICTTPSLRSVVGACWAADCTQLALILRGNCILGRPITTTDLHFDTKEWANYATEMHFTGNPPPILHFNPLNLHFVCEIATQFAF